MKADPAWTLHGHALLMCLCNCHASLKLVNDPFAVAVFFVAVLCISLFRFRCGRVKLAKLRFTSTATKAAAGGLQARQVLAAARPKRKAAQAAAAKAIAAAAVDDSDVGLDELPPPAKKANRGRGRPPLTTQERAQRQVLKAAAARTDLIIVSITVVNKTQEIERNIYEDLFTWVQSQPAGGLALERGGTYGHLHIQGVAKVFAVTPQQVNKMIKVRHTGFCLFVCV